MNKPSRMTVVLFLTGLFGLCGVHTSLAAGDADAGAAKATACGACHGTDGISNNELWPHLAGQREAYLVKQIKEFRDGVRSEPTMIGFVANLTDQDVEDLAAFYANQAACP